MDTYGVNGQAIAMGNARRDAVRDLNERIQQHNTDIAAQLATNMGEKKTSEKIRDAQQTAQGIWTGAHVPDKVKKFQSWREGNRWFDTGTDDTKANPTANAAAAQREAVEARGPPAAKIKLGNREIPSSTPANLEEDAAGALKESSSIGDKASSVLGAAGKVGGGLLSAAVGGMDIYQDVKAGGIAGNNNWEKAGNLLQIGGSISDIAGTIFPPAALIGGVLDLAASATDEVGEQLEESKEGDELKKQQADAQEALVAAPVAQAVVTGDVQ
tara:strand:+ start:2254 stop:3066 length:813 start_codon:yes stop_codon:yes gene_type:complete